MNGGVLAIALVLVLAYAFVWRVTHAVRPPRPAVPRRTRRPSLLSPFEHVMCLLVVLLGSPAQRRRVRGIIRRRRARLAEEAERAAAPVPEPKRARSHPVAPAAGLPGPVIHLAPRPSDELLERVRAKGYQVRPYVEGHPVGVACAACQDFSAAVSHLMRQMADSFSVPGASMSFSPDKLSGRFTLSFEDVLSDDDASPGRRQP